MIISSTTRPRRTAVAAAAAAALVALAATQPAVGGAAPTPETAFVAHWSAPYRAFAHAVSVSITACFPTDHPRCAPTQLEAAALAPPVLHALAAYAPPASLKADDAKLRAGITAVERTLRSSGHHPSSRAFCRGEMGPCTGAFALVVDAITDITNLTQLDLPIPQ